jgi:predicted ester cyclase
MSQEANKIVVQRFNAEVIASGNRDAFDELMSPTFVNRSAPVGAPDGPESLWHTFENILRPAIADLTVHILDQIAEGDKVTTRKTITGLHTGTLMGIAPTGRAVSIDVIDIIRVQDGRYAEHWGINTLPVLLAHLRQI